MPLFLVNPNDRQEEVLVTVFHLRRCSMHRSLLRLLGVLLLAVVLISPSNATTATTATVPSSLVPIPGPIDYGPCYYPGDALQTLDTNGRPVVPHPEDIREFCPDAVVNGIPEACRKYWMIQAKRLPFDNAVQTKNLYCPGNMFSAVLVDHTDGSATNEIQDGYNCGSLAINGNGVPRAAMYSDSVESEILRFMGVRFNDTKHDRRFWNKYSMYVTAEPTAAAMVQMVSLGIREVVYSVPMGELVYHGYSLVKIRAIDVLKQQPATYESPRSAVITTTLIGQVLRGEISQHFTWRFNSSIPCPGDCQSYKENSTRGLRCRISL